MQVKDHEYTSSLAGLTEFYLVSVNLDTIWVAFATLGALVKYVWRAYEAASEFIRL